MPDGGGAGREDVRAELVAYARAMGATEAELAAAANPGELALDLHLRPRTGHTLGGVVAAAGLDPARAQRFLAATGLPIDPEARVTAAEADAVRLFAAVGGELLGDDATAQLARVTGAATARIAEALVSAFRLHFEVPRLASGTPYVEVVKEYATLAESMLPAFVGAIDAMLRRQVVAVAERMWTTDDERTAVTLRRTVGFADLVGYSTVAANLTLRELVDALVTFDERTSDVVRRHGGQVVKTIGDEVMFLTEDPGAACAIAVELIDVFDAGDVAPVRVGLAAGDVVSLFGDVYGPDVNLAARLVGLADASSAVVSAAVRDACAGRFRFEPLPPATVKGFAEPLVAHHLIGEEPDA